MTITLLLIIVIYYFEGSWRGLIMDFRGNREYETDKELCVSFNVLSNV